MNSDDTNVDFICIKRLRQEALNCLNKFPSRVFHLNDLIADYMPESMKNVASDSLQKLCRTNSKLSINWDEANVRRATICQFDAKSYYSPSTCGSSKVCRGIRKRKYSRIRRTNNATWRQRPSPLAHFLSFIISKLINFTSQVVISPLWLTVETIIGSSSFVERRSKSSLRNANCGTPTSLSQWQYSLLDCVITCRKDASIIARLLTIMKPAAMQLISDTAVIKQWLQALALSKSFSLSNNNLEDATRCVETIDRWAYELFFHIKIIQRDRLAQTRNDNATDIKEIKTDDSIHANLWHRMVQLRNNYISLYETLFNNEM